jgi:hypothetical protein
MPAAEPKNRSTIGDIFVTETTVFLLVGAVAVVLLLMSFDRPIRNAARKLRRRLSRPRR